MEEEANWLVLRQMEWMGDKQMHIFIQKLQETVEAIGPRAFQKYIAERGGTITPQADDEV